MQNKTDNNQGTGKSYSTANITHSVLISLPSHVLLHISGHSSLIRLVSGPNRGGHGIACPTFSDADGQCITNVSMVCALGSSSFLQRPSLTQKMATGFSTMSVQDALFLRINNISTNMRVHTQFLRGIFTQCKANLRQRR